MSQANILKTNRVDFLNDDGTVANSLYLSAGSLTLDGSPLDTGGSTPAEISLADTHILVGQSTGKAGDKALSGDATIDHDGVLTVANASVIGKLLTGYTKGAGVVAETDSILAAIQKLAGNDDAISIDATINLTQANIVGMYGADIPLLAAPGSGKAYVIDEIEVFHNYDTAVYSGGGDVTIKYGAATAITLIDKGLVTGAGDKNVLIKPMIYDLDTSTGTSEGFDFSGVVNNAVNISNATGAFADGAATNILKVRIRYHVVTLLT